MRTVNTCPALPGRGLVLYTTQSGQYGPMHTQVISATASEAPYVLDGLHPQAHRTSLRITEH